jgi:threonine/homoserine/homoserine lactone efflux protein
MPDLTPFVLYFAAAFLLAITPGPGIFYVAARTLAGDRAEASPPATAAMPRLDDRLLDLTA